MIKIIFGFPELQRKWYKYKYFLILLNKFFEEIRTIGGNVLRKEQDILSFNWPDDTLFDKWVTNYALALT